MIKHEGQILEYSIRKVGFNISELADTLGVNRRTLYNWFQTPRLKLDIIYRIGKIIRHDFSRDFPELLTHSERETPSKPNIQDSILNDELWKNKYISLLEDYNKLLVQRINNDNDCLIFPS